MPRWGRPPGAQLGRQARRRGGPWVDSDPRVEEIESDAGDQFGSRDDRTLYARQLASLHMDGGNGWRRFVAEQDGHANALAPVNGVDGMDYDMYEDTDNTVAYAIQLAMKDKEEWLVDKALERIRRAQFDGQKNVRLSKRELEALERKRLQSNGMRETERKNVSPRHSKTMGNANGMTGTTSVRRTVASMSPNAPAPPYPLSDTGSAYGTWARATGSSIGNQNSKSSQSPTTTMLRAPLQPPFTPERHHAGALNRPPPFFVPPGYSRPYPEDYQQMPSYQAPLSHEQVSHPTNSPIDPTRGSPVRPGQSPYVSNFPSVFDERQPPSLQASRAPSIRDRGSATPEPPPSRGEGSKKGSPTNSGDVVHVVEVAEHKVPSTPTRAATSRGSRQRSSR
ncbi:hypothetical protein P175DRAFT_0533667 [Aspergillus ochraceoroseus IBT 24754]|uniref:Prenylated Rab acceptor 1 n=3 Tax=Aspergillus subgen. Nidulantes TaxID=2720870 RepID=A0A0F8V060_9EURO|nr:uncharacterized protein P175DRAFT_0533667 [Aspergillus ochraceoroseus IBT 24754]KKK24762.1 hypothetical protein AOCH_002215 [Aspergillus ochraceoroseus]KKK25129.1 hypothetical protein ARAM_003476 [Aspergillus rambellii]PTU19239.1 hypothetical protein P175DRAFT_0533667 [Aspergillus ochraceoroseus IBT 24754]